MINRRRFAELLADAPQNIEIRQRGFHQNDVRTFLDIERHFAQRFLRVRAIHLIGTPVAELRRALRGLAERPVKGRRKLGRVAHDACVLKAVAIECFANGADPAVHHVARGDEIRAGRGVRDRGLGEQFDGLIVQNVEMIAVDPRHAAMPVAHVLA